MLLAASVLLAAAVSARERKFYPDDPLLVDDALVDVVERPAELELSDLYDRFGHMFKDWGASPLGSEAANVNTLDEVPDSPWFTNRHARQAGLEEIARGPNRGEGPDPEGTWTVFRSKSQGLTPGFQIVDERGDRYVIKLDPVDVPELSSAAEVVSTKIFHALGYNVPENYIVRFHPDHFAIQEGTLVEDRFGDKMPLTPFRFRRMIRRVPRDESGRMRVTASKYIEGVPIGPFRYYETRTDDPNDVVPHEDRRELRGLRLFAAWLNHDDTRAHNTQSSWVEERGRHVLRHYLIDFGSTLGSGSVKIQDAELGVHYFMDAELMKKNLTGLGFHVPLYRKARWPALPEFQAVGRLESELFDCAAWKGNYPNPAFERMTARDAFWAAKILMTLDREALAAIVETGEYSRHEDAALLLQLLRERQLACGRFGINAIDPLDAFRVEGGALLFENLSERYGFVLTPSRYEIAWHTYDNETGESRSLGAPVTQEALRAELPPVASRELFLVAELRTKNEDFPHWSAAVRVYLRPEGDGYEVVGIDRESPERSTFPMS